MKRFTTALKTTTMAFAVAGLMASSAAYATEGMHGHGNGVRQKALAGAGVADSTDATAASLNPAGLVHVENQLDVGISLFRPERAARRSVGDTGDWVESDSSIFVIPNIAYSHRLDATSVFGFTAYANGGMNVDYPGNKNFLAPNNGEIKFGSGNLFTNIEQLNVSVAYAKQMGSFAFGIAPIFAIQSAEVKGIGNFAGWTTDAANFNDRGKDWSFGGGLRAGVEWEAMQGIRFGLAGSTPMWMTKMKKYKGLFAEQGGANQAATLQLGLAADVTPALTFMVDYKRIFYGSLNSLANHGPIFGENISSTPLNPQSYHPTPGRSLGADGGIGFGWHDIDIIKVGVEWDMDPSTTLRLGYSYNQNPLDSDDLVFNILAPATIKHHFTGGLKLAATENLDIEFAGAYMPEEEMNGKDGQSGGTVGVKMSQWELSGGFKWKLGE